MRQKIEQIDVNNENLSGEARMVGNSVFSELVSKFKQTAIGSDRFSKTLRRIVDSQGEQIVIDGSEDKWLNPSERSVSDWVLVAAEKAQLELDAQGKGLNESQGAEYLKLDAKANRLENKIKRVNNGKRSIRNHRNPRN